MESDYQAKLIKKLQSKFPGCLVLKNDPTYLQGIPDLLILFEDMWAALEVKDSEDAADQPNQWWYIEKMDNMSYADFIYPENEGSVLRALQRSFETRRAARFPQPQ